MNCVNKSLRVLSGIFDDGEFQNYCISFFWRGNVENYAEVPDWDCENLTLSRQLAVHSVLNSKGLEGCKRKAQSGRVAMWTTMKKESVECSCLVYPGTPCTCFVRYGKD